MYEYGAQLGHLEYNKCKNKVQSFDKLRKFRYL